MIEDSALARWRVRVLRVGPDEFAALGHRGCMTRGGAFIPNMSMWARGGTAHHAIYNWFVYLEGYAARGSGIVDG